MTSPNRRMLLAPARVLRYAVSGGASTVTHGGALVLLVEGAEVPPVLASILGFVLSAVVSYSLQRWWVFSSKTKHSTAIPRFLVVAAVGLLINAATMVIGESLGVYYLWAQGVAFVLVPISNYILNGLWTFRESVSSEPVSSHLGVAQS